MRHCQVHDESDYFKHVSHVNGKFLPNDVILVMMLEVEEEEEEESIVKKQRASVEWNKFRLRIWGILIRSTDET